MPLNGAGTYSRTGTPYQAGNKIQPDEVNAEHDDFATALSTAIYKDGQTTPTANLPMGSFRHTGVGNAVNRDEYATYGQLQDGGSTVWKTPYSYGAQVGSERSVDNSSFIQDLIDAATASWDATRYDFTIKVDLAGQMWRIDTGLYMNAIRQPGMVVRNGGLYCNGSGIIGLDCTKGNRLTLQNLRIYGDETNTPIVGILYGRDNTLLPAPEMLMLNVMTDGFYSKLAVCNIASEIDELLGCRFINRSRSYTAYAFACVDHMKTLDDYVGGLTSPNITLPTASDGNMSNILHQWHSLYAIRQADYNLSVTSVTKANPAVVTLSAGDVAANSISNGDEVFFGQALGMTEINGQYYTVANVSGDTFELSGVDSTSYGTFTSGFLNNRNGHSILLAGADAINAEDIWTLTYGASPLHFDVANGPFRQANISLQAEKHPVSFAKFTEHASNVTVIQGASFLDLSKNQNYSDSVIENTGGGGLQFHGLNMRIVNEGTVPPNKLFKNPGVVTIFNGDLQMPSSSNFNPESAYAVYQVRETAYDRSPKTIDYQNVSYRGQPSWDAMAANTVVGRMRAYDDTSAAGPLFDIDRESASPAASDNLGQIRFTGSNSAGDQVPFATLAAVMTDPTDTSEDGYLRLLAAIAGTVTEIMRAQATSGAGTTGLQLLVDASGSGATLQAVTVGASDSGGTGFRALRVPN